MTDEVMLELGSKFNFRTIPLLLLLLPSTSKVFTFFGSKLFLLFLFDAEDGEEEIVVPFIIMHLFEGDIMGITMDELLFMDAIENCDELFKLVFPGNVLSEIEVANFKSSGGEALFNNTGLVVGVINLNNA